nr:reverse transcriptase domain-containing protein [Tanacetum cinerariifolium]
MTTRSAGRASAAPRGGRTGGQTGREGGRIRGRFLVIWEMVGLMVKATKVAIEEMIGTRTEMQSMTTFKIHTRSREDAVSMSWEDFKTLTREEFYPSNEMQKLETELWNHAMVGVGHAAYTDRFHELARLVPHLITPTNKRIERNVSIKKNHKKRGNGREPSKDRNGRDDNKRTR